jgi:hypothetical protein
MEGLWALAVLICLVRQRQQGLVGCLEQQEGWAEQQQMQMQQQQQGLGCRHLGVLECLIPMLWV